MTTTIGTISAALQLVDGKKESLRKAFEELQSQSQFHSLSSFNLTWSDLDSHFSSVQSSLEHKFKLIQSIDPQSQPPKPPPSTAVPARPELKSLCENMDGVGLLRYLSERRGERTSVELPDAYRSAPDAAAMVLDGMEKGKDLELDNFMNICVLMLEELMRVKPEVSAEVREKALKLAVQWRESIESLDIKDKPLGILRFLHLVAVYDLAGFNMDELIDYVVAICKRRQALDLCRAVISADRISDLIQKLIYKDKKLVAVKFSYEFKKTDKFPLVPLLKEYRQETRKNTRKVLNNGKSSLQALNGATEKDIGTLKSIIKCIEDYHLESEYPKHTLVSLVEKLEKEKANKKRPAAAPVPKSEKPRTSKLPRTAGSARQESKSKSDSNVFPPQQTQVQAAALLPDLAAQYVNQAGPYVVAGANHAIPYMGSNASSYGYIAGPLGFNGNSTVNGSNLYPPEQHPPPLGYYSAPVPNGGFNLQPPQYHPSYYPQ